MQTEGLHKKVHNREKRDIGERKRERERERERERKEAHSRERDRQTDNRTDRPDRQKYSRSEGRKRKKN